MSKLVFQSNDRPTLGVEVELGLVDAETLELDSSCCRLLEAIPESVLVGCKPELMQKLRRSHHRCLQLGRRRRTRLAREAAARAKGLREPGAQALVGFNASVQRLATAASHAQRTLQQPDGLAAGNGEAPGHVWLACPRRRRFRRQGGDDLRSDHATLAGHVGVNVQQSILGRPAYRPAFPTLQNHGGSADGRPAHLDAQLERIRLAGPPHGGHRLHQHDSRDLVGCSPAS